MAVDRELLEDAESTVRPCPDTLLAVRRALEQGGVKFTFEPGRKPGIRQACVRYGHSSGRPWHLVSSLEQLAAGVGEDPHQSCDLGHAGRGLHESDSQFLFESRFLDRSRKRRSQLLY